MGIEIHLAISKSVTKEEWEKGETYVSLMKNNLESLKKALK